MGERSRRMRLLGGAAFMLAAAICPAADWPTYMHDKFRSGITPEELRPPLQARWVFKPNNPPRPAWPPPVPVVEGVPEPHRLNFDYAHHAVVADGKVYFGSSANDKVYCLDADTGKVIWTFFTGGPVRLAPTVWNGRVYFGSDDGFVYCLDAKTGGLIWKFKAGPTDERVMGNGRLISLWPVRTGVLVDDGVAYFGAGVFPYEGVFLYAVSAEDGRLIWRNDSWGLFRGGWGSRSPQGYLLASDDRLFVPAGRTLPACFSRKDGNLLYQHERSWLGPFGLKPTLVGGAYALVAEGCLYTEANVVGALDIKTGRTVIAWFPGKRLVVTADTSYLATGSEILALDRAKYPELSRRRLDLKGRLWNLDNRRYMLNRQRNSLKGRIAEVERTVKGLERQIEEAKRRGETAKVEALQKQREKAASELESLNKQLKTVEGQLTDLEAQVEKTTEELKSVEERLQKETVRWSVKTDCADSMIMAGDMLYAGGDGKVVAIDSRSGKLLWTGKVEGRAMGLAVSDGKLFASTDKGLIYCFAPSPVPSAQSPTEIEEGTLSEPFPPGPVGTLVSDAARRIVEETGIRRGICIVLGSGSGRLAFELAKLTDFQIYGLEEDGRLVEGARTALDKAGLYGVRVAFHQGEISDRLPYPDYLADLVVSEDLVTAGRLGSWPVPPPEVWREVCRILKPCGGVALLGPFPKEQAGALGEALDRAGVTKFPGIVKAEVEEKEGGAWVRIERGKLPGAGSWTHQYANPGNTSSTEDLIVKYPLGILWFGEPGPTKMPSRHAQNIAPMSTGGRFFVEGMDVVMAFDAYNGTKLWEWEKKGATCTGVIRRGANMACNEEAVFVAVEGTCYMLDAGMGRIVKTFEVPSASELERFLPPEALAELGAKMGPFYAAPKLTLKVDGDLSDWGEVEPAQVPAPGTRLKHYRDWKGPGDLSGKIFLAWDEKNFYFAASVVDDVFHQPYANDRIWEADCIQIAFDIERKMSYDREWGLCLSPKGPFVWCWFGPKETAKAIKLAVKRTNGGAVYEAAIPWEALKPFKPAPGRAIGFSAVVMDSDGAGWEGGVEWASGIVEGKDPSLFGAVGLVSKQGSSEEGELRRKIEGERRIAPRKWGYVAVVGPNLFGSMSHRTGWSDVLFMRDIETGALVWARKVGDVAHNSIAVGDSMLFYLDRKVTVAEREEALRAKLEKLGTLSGVEAERLRAEIGRADVRRLVCLNALTGREIWSKPLDVTNCGPPVHLIYHKGRLVVCGAFQNGHFWREFFAGELAGRRIVVLSARDGSIVWDKPCNYFTRPLVLGDKIFADPWIYDLETGEKVTIEHPITGEKIPFELGRGHHCGPLSACPNLLALRSLTSAFYPLDRMQGPVHFGGHRPGCHINMIPANGLLLEPEASSGCVCPFSLYSTVVFEPRKVDRGWGWFTCPPNAPSVPVRHLAVNLGAPGDRRADDGTLWLSYPRPEIPLVLRFDLKVQFLPGGGYFMLNPDFVKVEGTDKPWLYTFGCLGLGRLTVPVLGEGERSARFTVRLGFCELVEDERPGERAFDVKIQGKTVAEGLDIVKEAGGPLRAMVREFRGVEVSGGPLAVEFVPREPLPKEPAKFKRAAPLLCTLEVVRE